jgi:hypothetical protein
VYALGSSPSRRASRDPERLVDQAADLDRARAPVALEDLDVNAVSGTDRQPPRELRGDQQAALGRLDGPDAAIEQVAQHRRGGEPGDRRVAPPRSRDDPHRHHALDLGELDAGHALELVGGASPGGRAAA